jgi:hypothetical protein
MASQRIRLGVVLAGVLICGPVAYGQTAHPAPGAGVPLPPPPPTSTGTGVPYTAQPLAPGAAGPMTTLTAPPGPAHAGPMIQPLWCGGLPAGAECCGPVGANGPVTYELYARTGPSLPIGGSRVFSGALQTGWHVAGGGRSLFFNPAGDAAWYLDLGLGYTYNRGTDRVINVFSPQPRDQFTGELLGPDEIHPFQLRVMHRTTFNYGVGRAWWLNGPGHPGADCGWWNSRLALDVTGRWGTNHVELVPVFEPENYLRRSGISHGLFLGANWDWERAMGGWIFFGGVRAEWGYTWMNLVPPQDGDLQDVNLLMTLGVRF